MLTFIAIGVLILLFAPTGVVVVIKDSRDDGPDWRS
jgi:hypothetical protein